jgi:hypothetical protein
MNTREFVADFNWIQNSDNENFKRVLKKTQVIYIGYYNNNDYSSISYVDELKDSYDKMKTLENALVVSRVNGNLDREITFKELKRADKQLRFMSKIPKSILENEENQSTDIRYNKFLEKIINIFINELFEEIIKK